MATRRVTKIQRYVEAQLALRAMKQQLVDYPENGDSPKWLADFRDAKAEVVAAYRELRGGDLGKANILLASNGNDRQCTQCGQVLGGHNRTLHPTPCRGQAR